MAKIARTVLPFTVERQPSDTTLTSMAGVPLVIESLRAMIGEARYVSLAKAAGLEDWQVARRHVETLVALLAGGGEALDDVAVLRSDAGFEALVGYKPSSATQLKDFLYRFHQSEDGRRLPANADAELATKGKATIRAEGPALRVLGEMLREVVHGLQKLRPVDTATLDVDATVIEASKKYALRTYEGVRGYQPQMAWWAEHEVWVADEFRDGNVNAEFQARAFLRKAFRALPGSVRTRRLRADSALYNEDALTWAHNAGIQFAVSADMSVGLAKAAARVPEARWKPYRATEDSASEERQWAEVLDFVPEWKRNRRKKGHAFRYIVVRVRSSEHGLFPETEPWKHFAIVTNADGQGDTLLRWHRKKQGTVEHGHDVMKNGLGAGTLPCGRFGSNAAWWRIAAILHNLLRLMQTHVLDERMHAMKPKALRFHLLRLAGKVIRHGRRLILRLVASLDVVDLFIAARARLAALAAIAEVKSG